MDIQLPIILFGSLIGTIGFLLGSLLTSLWLKPSVVRNDQRIFEHERRLNSFEKIVGDIYGKINEIYKIVVKKRGNYD